MAIRTRLYQILAQRKNGGNRITIKQLAKAANVHYQTLWRWANNETSSVSYTILDALCRELNVTPGDLLAYVPDDEPEPATTGPTSRDGQAAGVAETESKLTAS